MATGKKERVMIACVTFETVKITKPVKFYDSTVVHLIHYIDKSKTEGETKVYKEFYQEVVEQIGSFERGTVIKEHIEPVSDFKSMLRLILNIINEEKENDIMVNISAGTSEYAAAAAIASMMNEGVVAFSVGSKEYTIPDDKIEELYYRDGKPVGLAADVYDPCVMPLYYIKKPDKTLVRGLRVYSKCLSLKRKPSRDAVCDIFREKGIWLREKPEKNKKQTDAVNFQRDFIMGWQKHEWIEKDEERKTMRLTEEGLNVISTYHTEYQKEDERVTEADLNRR